MDSTSKCTTEGFEDDLKWCSVVKALARPIVQRMDNDGKLIIGYLREVGSLRKVPMQHSISVLVGPALPGAVRIGKSKYRP